MRTLLFDLRASQPGVLGDHGGAEYTRAVFRYVARMTRDTPIRAFYDTLRPLPEDMRSAAHDAGIPLVEVRSLQDVQDLLDDPVFDRFYSALPYEYGDLNFRNLDLLLTIHDLRSLLTGTDAYAWRYASSLKEVVTLQAKRSLPGLYRWYKRRHFERLLRPKGRRRRIIVPSEHTKYSILVSFPWVRSEEILVCYSPRTAVCDRQDTDASLIERLGLVDRGYILLVSSDRWMKNSYRAILAIEELFERRPDLERKRIVAVGGAPARAPRCWRDEHLFLGNVDIRLLATLYRHAFVLFYPSLNEGFGYPPLESMSYGTPVIASASSAIPEISGDGALYVTPQSIDEMQNRLCWLSNDEQAWTHCSERASLRYRTVSAAQDQMLAQLCGLLVQADA